MTKQLILSCLLTSVTFAGEFISKSQLQHNDVVSFKSEKSGMYLTFSNSRKLAPNSGTVSINRGKFQVKVTDQGLRLKPMGGDNAHMYVYSDEDGNASYTTTAYLPEKIRASTFWIWQKTGSNSEYVAIANAMLGKQLKTGDSEGSWCKFNTTKDTTNTNYLIYRH